MHDIYTAVQLYPDPFYKPKVLGWFEKYWRDFVLLGAMMIMMLLPYIFTAAAPAAPIMGTALWATKSIGAILVGVLVVGMKAALSGIIVGGVLSGLAAALYGGDIWDSIVKGALNGAFWGFIIAITVYAIATVARCVRELRQIANNARQAAKAQKALMDMQGAVSGTEKMVTLQPGHQLDRYGSLSGRYMTDFGTPVEELALPSTNNMVKTSLKVVKPITIPSGVVAPQPWGVGGAILPGGGIQYFAPKGIQYLIDKGFLLII